MFGKVGDPVVTHTVTMEQTWGPITQVWLHRFVCECGTKSLWHKDPTRPEVRATMHQAIAQDPARHFWQHPRTDQPWSTDSPCRWCGQSCDAHTYTGRGL